MSEIGKLSLPEALRAYGEYARARQKLGKIGLTRGTADPEGQFAEWLVAELLGGDLQPLNTPGLDVKLQDGRTVQVKKVHRGCGSRDLPRAREQETDLLAYVFFAGDGSPTDVYVCRWDWAQGVREPRDGARLQRRDLEEAGGVQHFSLDAEAAQVATGNAGNGRSRGRGPQGDPLIALVGSVRSDLTDVADRHDHYLGLALASELDPQRA